MARMFVKQGHVYAKWENGHLYYWEFRRGLEFFPVEPATGVRAIACYAKGQSPYFPLVDSGEHPDGYCRSYTPPMTPRWARRARRWLRCLQMWRRVA